MERSGKRYSGKPDGVAERPKEKLQVNKTIRKFKDESQQAFLVSLRAGKFLFTKHSHIFILFRTFVGRNLFRLMSLNSKILWRLYIMN